MSNQQRQRPKDREVVELNGVKNFVVSAGEKFFSIEEGGTTRTDYARRENDNYGFPVRTNDAIEFVDKANAISERLLQDLIDFYKSKEEDIGDWRELAKKEGLMLSTSVRICRAIKDN